jgi:predicted secreted acid phosphatase
MHMRRALAIVSVFATVAFIAPPAAGDVGKQTRPVDTGQNLPSLGATEMYMAGVGMAPQIEAYRASGAYQAAQTRIANKARAFVDKAIKECARKPGCKPAVVFDIDDTLVSWYAVYAANQFSVPTAVADAVIESCETPAIGSVRALYNYARAKGAAPFLITGRKDVGRTFTVSCLAERNITGYRELVMRGPAQYELTAAVFKERERKRITKNGWSILFSIGDQYSDSAGKYSGGKFVLPNPMYFIP